MQADASKYLVFCAVMVLLHNTGTALGLLLASLHKDLEVTMIIAQLILMPLNLFAGMYVCMYVCVRDCW